MTLPNDLFKRTPRIPSQTINVEAISEAVQARLVYLPIGTYGNNNYSRCVYGSNYAFYGTVDVYGDAVYW